MEKKPMSDCLASNLCKALPLIEEDVEPNELHTHLIAKRIIDFNDKETILKAGNRKERASCLVSILMKRGDNAYLCFLEALQKANYTHIVNKISEFSFNNNSEGSDGGAGAAHGNLATAPLQKKVENLEKQISQHEFKLKNLDERLNVVETKEELKNIQQELMKLVNAETEMIQEIKNLKSQVQKKEEELASLANKTFAKVKKLEDEIASLKQDAEKREQELQQYKRDKAELEGKLKDLQISFDECNAKLKQLEDSRQKDANANEAKFKQLQEQMQLVLESKAQDSYIQRPQQPTSGACSPQDPKISIDPEPPHRPKTNEAQGPSNQSHLKTFTKIQRPPVSNIQPPETDIKGPNSQQQQSTTGTSTQPVDTKAQVSKTTRSTLPLKAPYIQRPEPKESNQREKPF